MTATRHLWDALRDFFGLGGDGTRSGTGSSQALRERLAALGEALALAAEELRAARVAVRRAERARLAHLDAAARAEEAGDATRAQLAREAAQTEGASLDGALRAFDVAERHHATLHAAREALATEVRAAEADDSAARGAAPRASDPGVEDACAALRARLGALASAPRAAAPTRRALEQLEALDAHTGAFFAVLGRKLAPGELTYMRYAGAAERLRRSVLDQLDDALDSLPVLAELDVDALEATLAGLRAGGSSAAAAQRSARAVEDRLALRTTHAERVERLLARNEEALTTLVRATTAIAQMPPLERSAPVAFTQALDDLEQLAVRAAAYR